MTIHLRPQRIAFVAAVAGALLLSLIGPPALAQSTATPPPSGSTTPEQRGATHPDRNFFHEAARAGLVEVEASKMALAKADSAQVKQFAQRMIDDHTIAAKELEALAQGKGVTLPKEPSRMQRTRLSGLESLSGPRFDARYAEFIGVDSHRQAVQLFERASRRAQDADVRSFAAKTLPTLQDHHKMAEQLAAAVTRAAR